MIFIAGFVMITECILVNRENVEPILAKYIANTLSSHTRDVREAIHFGRLARNEKDVNELLHLKFPKA
jgi:hypothetical protein